MRGVEGRGDKSIDKNNGRNNGRDGVVTEAEVNIKTAAGMATEFAVKIVVRARSLGMFMHHAM